MTAVTSGEVDRTVAILRAGSPVPGVASKVRKVQGTSVPAGGLGVSPRFKLPLSCGEGDTGGEV